MLIKFASPDEEHEPTTHLKECITALEYYLVDKGPDTDFVGLRIRNTENVQDKLVGISFRRWGQLEPYVVWDALGKVIQSNASFRLTDRLELHLNHVRMPIGKGQERTKVRSLSVLSAIKNSIVVVKAPFLCLAHELIIAMVRVNGDQKYKSYRDGKYLKTPVDDTLKASGVDLSHGRGLEEIRQFQAHFSGYKIAVWWT